jgi:AraC family transcriptional regulator of adaptative response/methylated-DNA-[protein]-cysteine methyltransferase
MTIIVKSLQTPVGAMTAGVYDNKICLLEFGIRDRLSKQIQTLQKQLKAEISEGESPLIDELEKQLDEYFGGKRKNFELPLLVSGSDFQKKVWNTLLQIPYGETRSYQQQAVACGNVKALRASASANGANRIAIVIPCHRVIGKNGSLTGFGGGLDNKKFLLDLERKYSGKI